MKKFTNREFGALSTEVFKVAKTIANKTINSCSLYMDNDYIELLVEGDATEEYKRKCIVFFYKDRFAKVSEFRNFYKVLSVIPNVTYGKYLSIIFQEYMNCDKSETYFEF